MYYSCQKGILDVNIYWSWIIQIWNESKHLTSIELLNKWIEYFHQNDYCKCIIHPKIIFVYLYSTKILSLIQILLFPFVLGQYPLYNLDCICKKWSYVCLRHKKIKMGISWFCLFFLNYSNKTFLLRTTFEYAIKD